MQLRSWKKRAMEAGFLVALIITIAGGLLVGGVVMRFMSSASDKEAENLCHDSVALRAKTVITHEGKVLDTEIKAVPALCKTIDKKIQGDREEIKEQFAYKIARCWWMFGEGRYEELLDSSSIKLFPSVLGFDRTKSKCFVCYNLMVDQDEIEGGPIPPWEMDEYMSNHKYPGSEITYLQYIQNYGGPGKVVFMSSAILPENSYGIEMLPKNKEGQSFLNSLTRFGVGGTIAVVAAGVGACIIAGPLCVGLATTEIGLAVTSVVSTKAAVIAAGALVVGGGTVAASGVSNIYAKLYTNREFSSIAIDSSMNAEEKCGSGDIAGE